MGKAASYFPPDDMKTLSSLDEFLVLCWSCEEDSLRPETMIKQAFTRCKKQLGDGVTVLHSLKNGSFCLPVKEDLSYGWLWPSDFEDGKKIKSG
ncbi:hypothetical protein CK203_037327 [Vitis vinifera]|uniref:Uncharacterized protein n=1 Tax=Vitis vinifera TaxID=29760 RepID=A0A438H960_VITVI|nr:hypothetical protein CK203_037327 [Vitis vinifera]